MHKILCNNFFLFSHSTMSLLLLQSSLFPNFFFFSLHLITAIFFLTIVVPSNSSIDSFIYSGCSSQKYSNDISTINYQSNVKSFLNNIVYSSSFTFFNKFTITKPGSDPTAAAVVYGLFQCRGDLTNTNCRNCVARSAAELDLGTLCSGSTGVTLQLEGCLVKYDSVSFLGVEDKDVVTHRCGPASIPYNNGDRELVLGNLGNGDGYFRVSSYGNFKGLAQCVQDLSVDQCRDCLSEAIRRLKSECPASDSGDMFLVKCYVRFYDSGGPRTYSHHYDDENDDDDDYEVQKTIAILVGLIAGVALLIIFISAISKYFGKKGSNSK